MRNMIECGFFNSVGTDREYTAEDFNTFFEGLIPQNGIFENVGDGLTVSAAGNLKLNIGTGKAIVNNYWTKVTATEVITLDAANTLFNRYDMITLRADKSTRTVTLELTKGEESSSEPKPEPIRDDTQCEIALAYICVKANATTILPTDIIDCRYDSDLCGIITGLIQQVDVKNLYRQYAAQFKLLTEQMQGWMATQETAYNNWFSSLTDDLSCKTTLIRNVSNYLTVQEEGTQYIDVPSDLNYESGDILDIYNNGVLLIEKADYDLTMNDAENTPTIFFYSDIEKGNMITFNCLKNTAGTSIEINPVVLQEIIDVQTEILNTLNGGAE